ncbi:alpha/beta hydrolase, partial [Aquimarina celericrescens]|nr:alpha/beta hydrolase [Aquimarina celericrescens]
HKESISLFVREAKKLYQKEFIKWFKLTSEINPLLRFFRSKDISIPTLYMMGEEDYLFLPSVEKVVAAHQFSNLFIVKNSGHVVNVEQPEIFN